MLPNYVFDTPHLFFAFLEGPLSSEEMKVVLAKSGVQHFEHVYGVNSQLDFSDESTQYTQSVDVWCKRSEEYLRGRLDATCCSVYYEVGWELVIIGFNEESQFEVFTTDMKSDDHFKNLYWDIDELAQYKMELTSDLVTAKNVRTFFAEMIKNYS
ncbi:hypothetical protein [Phaeodactylibacter xiamenensis]|uniref:hypothetical protein n=1 Tax=Phaeodactylibacter xiamenensis TaxID=1524460 RepID=UPI003BAD6470